MAKHNPEIVNRLVPVAGSCDKISEKELLGALNSVIVAIEKDDTYSTRAKLKIFSLLTMLCNVEPKERRKYVRKVMKAVR